MDGLIQTNGPNAQASGAAGRSTASHYLDDPRVIDEPRVIDNPTPDTAPTRYRAADPGAPRYMPGIAAFRHPVIALIPVLIFAVLGMAYGSSRPPIYGAEARMLVGRLDASAQVIPGYAAATETLAGVYSRFATLPAVQADALSRMGHAVSPSFAASASPIPQSSEIRVDATSANQADAVRLADATVTAMVAYVNRLNASVTTPTMPDLQAQFSDATAKMEAAAQTVDDLNAQLTVLRDPKSAVANRNALTAVEQQLIPARSAVDQAKQQMNVIDAQMRALVAASPPSPVDQEGVIQAIQPAAGTGTNRMSKVELDTVAGVAAGGVIGLLLATGYDERRRRRRGFATGGKSFPA